MHRAQKIKIKSWRNKYGWRQSRKTDQNFNHILAENLRRPASILTKDSANPGLEARLQISDIYRLDAGKPTSLWKCY